MVYTVRVEIINGYVAFNQMLFRAVFNQFPWINGTQKPFTYCDKV